MLVLFRSGIDRTATGRQLLELIYLAFHSPYKTQGIDKQVSFPGCLVAAWYSRRNGSRLRFDGGPKLALKFRQGDRLEIPGRGCRWLKKQRGLQQLLMQRIAWLNILPQQGRQERQ